MKINIVENKPGFVRLMVFKSVLFFLLTSCGTGEPSISIVTDQNPGDPVIHGLSQLTDQLQAKKLTYEQVGSLEEARGTSIIVSGLANGEGTAAQMLGNEDRTVPDTPEALTIWSTGWQSRPLWVISGYDDRGLMYGLLDVADRISWSTDVDSPMSEVAEITERPDASERAVSIYTMNRAYWESRFYDEEYWARYLDNLAKNRFNSLVVIFGYENGGFLAPAYPYFFDMEGFPDVHMVGISPEEQQRNLDAFNRLIEMAHARGINFTVGIWDHIYRGGVQGGGIFACSDAACTQITVAYNTAQEPVEYAVNQLRRTLVQGGQSVQTWHLSQTFSELPAILILIQGDPLPALMENHVSRQDLEVIQPEGYEIRWINNGETLLILSADAVGAMYGVMDLVEYRQIYGDYHTIHDKVVNPLFEYRIIKFNLPWSPYRVNEATHIHTSVVRDLQYWERFLDMMVVNRLNVLSLWNNHPFPFMIRAVNFPEATPFDDREMEEWQKFWRALFSMAKQRGIQTFIVNWNIVVSPEFAEAYGASEYNDFSGLVKRYTRESVTQLLS